jgi:hypothetical protein
VIFDAHACIQQQRALGNGLFRAIVERRYASARPLHRPPAPKPSDKIR